MVQFERSGNIFFEVNDDKNLSAPRLNSYETLPDITELSWDCHPLVMHRLGKRGQQLLFIGVRHDSEPIESNPHYVKVRLATRNFMSLTEYDSRVVVVEGGIRQEVAGTLEEAYRQGGEGGIAAFYAAWHKVPQVCFEPDNQGVDYLLQQGFSAEEVALFLFARWVPSWYRGYTATLNDSTGRSISPQNFEDFAQGRLTGTGDMASSWPGFPFSYEQLKGMYEKTYGIPFTPEHQETVQFLLKETVGYMLPPGSRVHQAAIMVNHLRDKELAKGLHWLWNRGISALVPFGYSHGSTLQPFIETLGVDFRKRFPPTMSDGSYNGMQRKLLLPPYLRDIPN